MRTCWYYFSIYRYYRFLFLCVSMSLSHYLFSRICFLPSSIPFTLILSIPLFFCLFLSKPQNFSLLFHSSSLSFIHSLSLSHYPFSNRLNRNESTKGWELNESTFDDEIMCSKQFSVKIRMKKFKPLKFRDQKKM